MSWGSASRLGIVLPLGFRQGSGADRIHLLLPLVSAPRSTCIFLSVFPAGMGTPRRQRPSQAWERGRETRHFPPGRFVTTVQRALGGWGRREGCVVSCSKNVSVTVFEPPSPSGQSLSSVSPERWARQASLPTAGNPRPETSGGRRALGLRAHTWMPVGPLLIWVFSTASWTSLCSDAGKWGDETRARIP